MQQHQHQHYHYQQTILPSYANLSTSLNFDPSPSIGKRAQTTTIQPSNNISSTDLRRSYASPTATSSTSNALHSAATRKARSYVSSATTMMKPSIYPTGRYASSTLMPSDSDNRDPVASAVLKASINQQYRGKSPVNLSNSTASPSHSYYTRSKSSYPKY